MFNDSVPYKLVQVRKNRYPEHETFEHEFIYRFYRHNERSCIKYVVSSKTYVGGLLTLDYYPKINLTPKVNSVDNIQDLRYRALTRQNSFGVIGGTLLDIMSEITVITGYQNWGFLAANLPNEIRNSNNKRYKVYRKILTRTFYERHNVYGSKKNSAIFVIKGMDDEDAKKIIKRYEEIFAETN